MKTIWKDPIVEEVREAGRKFCERFGNDVDKIFAELRRRQKKHPHRVVNREKAELLGTAGGKRR